MYFAKDDSTMEVTPRACCWSMCNPDKANAAGLLVCLQDSLKSLGVEDILDRGSVLEVQNKPVLVAASTDGAAVNVAQQNGLRGRMQSLLPWLFWSWCFAHHLGLACLNAFPSP